MDAQVLGLHLALFYEGQGKKSDQELQGLVRAACEGTFGAAARNWQRCFPISQLELLLRVAT